MNISRDIASDRWNINNSKAFNCDNTIFYYKVTGVFFFNENRQVIYLLLLGFVMGIFISKLNKHNPLHSLRFSGTTKKGSWTGYERVSQHLGLFKTRFWTLFFTIGSLNLHTVLVWPFQTEADGLKDGFTFLILTFLVTNMFLCNQPLHQVRILVHYPTPKNTFSVQVNHQSSPGDIWPV